MSWQTTLARMLAPSVFADRDTLQEQVDELEREAQPLGDRFDIPTTERDTEFIDDSLRDSLGVLQRRDPYEQQSGSMYRVWQDETYWCPDKDAFRAFVGNTEVSTYTYETDRYDCEDFAGSFRARCVQELGINSVGMVGQWGDSAHVWNVVVYANGDVDMIEPQDARFVSEGDDAMYSLSNNGVFWL